MEAGVSVSMDYGENGGCTMKVTGKIKNLSAFSIIIGFLVMAFTVLFLFPFVNVLSTSFSDTVAIAKGEVIIWPVGFDLNAYRTLISDGGVILAYKNNVIYSLGGAIVTLIITTLTAYPLSIKSLKGRSLITIYFAVTMFFSGGMIPTYMVLRQLNLLNKIWCIILPPAISMWYIIIVRTSFQGIPDSLRESAWLDGASNFTVLFRIVVPLSKPVLSATALFTIVHQWNNYFTPMIYLSDNSKMPLQVVLRSIIAPAAESAERAVQGMLKAHSGSGTKAFNSFGYRESLRTAAMMLSIGPVIFAYPILQKYFVKGLLVGSIKG